MLNAKLSQKLNETLPGTYFRKAEKLATSLSKYLRHPTIGFDGNISSCITCEVKVIQHVSDNSVNKLTFCVALFLSRSNIIYQLAMMISFLLYQSLLRRVISLHQSTKSMWFWGLSVKVSCSEDLFSIFCPQDSRQAVITSIVQKSAVFVRPRQYVYDITWARKRRAKLLIVYLNRIWKNYMEAQALRTRQKVPESSQIGLCRLGLFYTILSKIQLQMS